MIDSLLAGKRVGYAMEAFNLRYAELAADLSERIEQIQLYDEHYEDSELAHMWIYNSDARNYAVIGDPAVRIPNAGELSREAASRAPSAPEVAAPTPPAPAARAAVPAEDPGRAGVEPPAYGWFGKDDEGGEGGEEGKEDGKEPGFLARLGSRVGAVLTGVLGDAAVLEVKTYTGGELQRVAAGDSLHASGARLRAYTRCELDGDIETCMPVNEGGAVDEGLWALHLQMVKQAQAHREELLRIVLSLFSSKVKK
jgi:hypothetical protein